MYIDYTMGLFGMLCAGFSFIGCIIFFKACCTTPYENNVNNYRCPNDWRPLIVHEIIVNNPNEYFNERVNECNEPNEYYNECVVNERNERVVNEPNEYIVYERPDKPPSYDSVMNSLPNDDVSY
jgi:hypothetical protein